MKERFGADPELLAAVPIVLIIGFIVLLLFSASVEQKNSGKLVEQIKKKEEKLKKKEEKLKKIEEQFKKAGFV